MRKGASEAGALLNGEGCCESGGLIFVCFVLLGGIVARMLV